MNRWWHRTGVIPFLAAVVVTSGLSPAFAQHNPNGYIRASGWNILLLNQANTGAAPLSMPCNGGGAENMKGNWVPPHDLRTEDPKAGDVWNDITFAAGKAIGWGGQKIGANPTWIGVDEAGNMTPAASDGSTVTGITVGDVVDFNQLVDRVNATVPTVAGTMPAMPNDNVVAIATTYVRNDNPAPLLVQVGGASDDSMLVYVNDILIYVRSACRGVLADLEDLGYAQLPPGISRITAMVFEGGGGWGLRLGIVRDGQRLNDVTGPAEGLEFLGNGAGDATIVGQVQGADPISRNYNPYGWLVARAFNFLGPLDDPYGGEAGNLQLNLANWTYPYDLRSENPKSGDQWNIDFTRAAATGYAARDFADAVGLGSVPTWFTYEDLATIADGFGVGELPGSGESGLPGNNNIVVGLEDMYRFLTAKLKPEGIPPIDGQDNVAGNRNCPNPNNYNTDCDPDYLLTIATTYVRNKTGADLPVRIALGADDSAVCFVNCQVAIAHSRAHGSAVFQEVRPAVLPPGISKIALVIWEGAGDHNFRLGIRPFGSLYNYSDGSPEVEFLGNGGGDASIVGVEQFCMERTTDTDPECRDEVTVTIKGNGKGDPSQPITVIERLNAYDLADLDITGIGAGGVVNEVKAEGYINLSSTGGDIWRDCDSFQFDHSILTGDFEVAVEILHRGHSSAHGRYGKFGLMGRFTLDPNSLYLMVQDLVPELLDGSRAATRRVNDNALVTNTGTNNRTVGADTCDITDEFGTGSDANVHPRFLRIKRTGQTLIVYRSNDLRIGDGTLDPLVDANWNIVRSQGFGISQTEGTAPNQTTLAIPELPEQLYVGFANSEHNSKGPALQKVVYRILPSSWTGSPDNRLASWDASERIGATDAGAMSATEAGQATIEKTITWTTTVGAVNSGLTYTIASKDNRTNYVDYLPPRRVDYNFVNVEGPTGNTFASPPNPPGIHNVGALISGSTQGLPINPKLYEPLNDTGVINLPLKPKGGPVGEFTESRDIGWFLNPSLPGSTSESGGVYTITGSGNDIWNDGDHFQFAYKEVTGDFVATVRLTDLVATPVPGQGWWARTGIMVRYTADPSSKHSMACVPYRAEIDPENLNDSRRHMSRRSHQPSWGAVNARDSSGTTTRDQQVVPFTAELDQGYKEWIRLTRIGSYFYSQFAADVDGQPGSWVLAGGDHHILPPDTLLLGLAAGAHSSYSPNEITVTFDNWSVVPLTQTEHVPQDLGVILEDDFGGILDPAYVRVNGTASAFSPAAVSGRLRLCQDGINNQANAVWLNTNGLDLGQTGFRAEFDAFYGKTSGSDPADGFTFAVVEGDFAARAPGLVGSQGGTLGYDKGNYNNRPAVRPRSFAVEVDWWFGDFTDNDPPGQGANGINNADDRYHMGIDFNAEVQSAVNNVEYGKTLPPFFNGPDGIHVEVVYDPADTTGTGVADIAVFVTGNDGKYPRTKVLGAKGPRFVGDVFVGFTGSTGGSTSTIEVDNLSIVQFGTPCEDDPETAVAAAPPGPHAVGAEVIISSAGSSAGARTWSIVSGPGEIVGAASGDTVIVKGNAAGDLVVGLKVDDGGCGPAGSTTVTITFESGGTRFRRGDVDGNKQPEITDAINILGYLFLGEGAPSCLQAADIDDSGLADITDAINLLGFLFLGGIAPAAPFPDCGTDTTPDQLGCGSSPGCLTR